MAAPVPASVSSDVPSHDTMIEMCSPAVKSLNDVPPVLVAVTVVEPAATVTVVPGPGAGRHTARSQKRGLSGSGRGPRAGVAPGGGRRATQTAAASL